MLRRIPSVGRPSSDGSDPSTSLWREGAAHSRAFLEKFVIRPIGWMGGRSGVILGRLRGSTDTAIMDNLWMDSSRFTLCPNALGRWG